MYNVSYDATPMYEPQLKKFRNCISTVTSVVNLGGRSVW